MLLLSSFLACARDAAMATVVVYVTRVPETVALSSHPSGPAAYVHCACDLQLAVAAPMPVHSTQEVAAAASCHFRARHLAAASTTPHHTSPPLTTNRSPP